MNDEQITAGIFLRRLERLIRVRQQYSQVLGEEDERLLIRAITASYGDCLDYGVACEADAILGKGRTP